MRYLFINQIFQAKSSVTLLLFLCLASGCTEGKQKEKPAETARLMPDFSKTTVYTPVIVSRENSQADLLHKEIMTIHDEIMPGMDDIMNLKRKIKTRLTALKPVHQANLNPVLKQQKQHLEQAVKALEASDEAMMDWMRQYSKGKNKLTSLEEAINYLQEQKARINSVKQRMHESITQAKQITN